MDVVDHLESTLHCIIQDDMQLELAEAMEIIRDYIDRLRSHNGQLTSKCREISKLSKKNTDLRKQVKSQQREIEELRHELDSFRSHSFTVSIPKGGINE